MRLLAFAVLACVALAAAAAPGADEAPAVVRLGEVNAALRGGDETALRAYVEASFHETMRNPGPADLGKRYARR